MPIVWRGGCGGVLSRTRLQAAVFAFRSGFARPEGS
jgi:hypothetical protein